MNGIASPASLHIYDLYAPVSGFLLLLGKNALLAETAGIVCLEPLVDAFGVETVAAGKTTELLFIFVLALTHLAPHLSMVLLLAFGHGRLKLERRDLVNVLLRNDSPSLLLDIADFISEPKHGIVRHLNLFFRSVLERVLLGHGGLQSGEVLLRILASILAEEGSAVVVRCHGFFRHELSGQLEGLGLLLHATAFLLTHLLLFLFLALFRFRQRPVVGINGGVLGIGLFHLLLIFFFGLFVIICSGSSS
mmetsp:Transcript_29003/g.84251  ORF Transcript_29003/g.84251 Transcript_29003/m.84251 type:complete len:249 (-) Transcript_29003:414-1160(-)